MTRRVREAAALGLAVVAVGLFRLVLLPLYPLCWAFERADGLRAGRGR